MKIVKFEMNVGEGFGAAAFMTDEGQIVRGYVEGSCEESIVALSKWLHQEIEDQRARSKEGLPPRVGDAVIQVSLGKGEVQ